MQSEFNRHQRWIVWVVYCCWFVGWRTRYERKLFHQLHCAYSFFTIPAFFFSLFVCMRVQVTTYTHLHIATVVCTKLQVGTLLNARRSTLDFSALVTTLDIRRYFVNLYNHSFEWTVFFSCWIDHQIETHRKVWKCYKW